MREGIAAIDRPTLAEDTASGSAGVATSEGVLLVTVQELLQALQADGWQVVHAEGSLHQLRHDSKPGLATLAGEPGLTLPAGVLGSLLGMAQLPKED